MQSLLQEVVKWVRRRQILVLCTSVGGILLASHLLWISALEDNYGPPSRNRVKLGRSPHSLPASQDAGTPQVHLSKVDTSYQAGLELCTEKSIFHYFFWPEMTPRFQSGAHEVIDTQSSSDKLQYEVISTSEYEGNSLADRVLYETRQFDDHVEQVIDYVPKKQSSDNHQSIDGIPKVALLFLLTHGLHLEPAWRIFFQAAATVVPKAKPPIEPELPLSDMLPKGRCRHEEVARSGQPYEPAKEPYGHEVLHAETGYRVGTLRSMEQSYPEDQSPQMLYQQQALFTVYVHLPPGQDLPEDSIFFGREITERVKTVYAQQSLAKAEIAMLRAAIANPLNQRFILLSESCFPLYPPEVLYLELLSEDKARINACAAHMDLNQERRERSRLQNYVPKSSWRKSQQWFGLTRPLVKLLLADAYVSHLFYNFCYSIGENLCVADEHQIATTIAMYGVEHLTYCPTKYSRLTKDVWDGKMSPKTFFSADLTLQLLSTLRGTNRTMEWEPETEMFCKANDAIHNSSKFFDYQPALRGADKGKQATLRKLPKSGSVGHVAAASRLLTQALQRHSAGSSEGQGLSHVPVQQVRQENHSKFEEKRQEYYASYNGVGPTCELIARKFAPEAVQSLVDIMLNCKGGQMGPQCYAERYGSGRSHT